MHGSAWVPPAKGLLVLQYLLVLLVLLVLS